MNTNNYVECSLELHLFFGRIMKEHSLFLEAGFTPASAAFSEKADFYKREFETLLCRAVMLSGGSVCRQVLNSNELVTEFTALAEKQTECFTGIAINKAITEKQLQMKNTCKGRIDGGELRRQVRQLNQTALTLLEGLICFKETILKKVLCGEMFTANYPLLIEHIIREARLYREYIERLERDGCLTADSMRDTECFWNRIMMEHAMFIRGLLDPSETELFNTADNFAEEYCALLENSRTAQEQAMTAAALQTTEKFRAFKAAGVQGIEQCKIRSIILPLLADHVLREANHYLRLLSCQNT